MGSDSQRSRIRERRRTDEDMAAVADMELGSHQISQCLHNTFSHVIGN